jgi:hypothetical protein
MRINESTIRRIIREEARRVLSEESASDFDGSRLGSYVADYLESIGEDWTAEVVRDSYHRQANMGVNLPSIYFKQNADGMAMYTLTDKSNGVKNHIGTISLQQYKDMEHDGKFDQEYKRKRDAALTPMGFNDPNRFKK